MARRLGGDRSGGLVLGCGGGRGSWVWRGLPVARRDQGDLVAQPGQGLLVVADEVLAIARDDSTTILAASSRNSGENVLFFPAT